MGVIVGGKEAHEVDDIHDPDPQIRKMRRSSHPAATVSWVGTSRVLGIWEWASIDDGITGAGRPESCVFDVHCRATDARPPLREISS